MFWSNLHIVKLWPLTFYYLTDFHAEMGMTSNETCVWK